MKYVSIAAFMLFAAALFAPADAQIPNAGFELWSGGLPTGWVTNNIPTFATTVTQSTTAHTGSYALQGSVVNWANVAAYPPYIYSFFGVAQRYATLSGWYRYTAVGGDSLYGWLVMMKKDTAIGYAFFSNKTTRATYTQFNATVSYFYSGVPDSCELWFGISGTSTNGDTVHVGSTFLLDDLALSGTATGIPTAGTLPPSYALEQNYPNPFNPSTVIRYNLAAAGPVRLTVYDVLGREVAVLAEGLQSAGTHELRFEGGGLASGVYFYRLQAGNYIQQKKMILQK